MTVVINEMDVVAPEPVAPPQTGGSGQPSKAEAERLVEQVSRSSRARAQRLRAY